MKNIGYVVPIGAKLLIFVDDTGPAPILKITGVHLL
jgi:hypothetical protein